MGSHTRPPACRSAALLCPSRDQLQQQLVQLSHHPGVVLTEGAAPVDQNPQHGKLFIVDQRMQPCHPRADQRDRVRVGGAGARFERGHLVERSAPDTAAAAA
jgi:hypothetical protein